MSALDEILKDVDLNYASSKRLSEAHEELKLLRETSFGWAASKLHGQPYDKEPSEVEYVVIRAGEYELHAEVAERWASSQMTDWSDSWKECKACPMCVTSFTGKTVTLTHKHDCKAARILDLKREGEG